MIVTYAEKFLLELPQLVIVSLILRLSAGACLAE
jgi:hypothetical protein